MAEIKLNNSLFPLYWYLLNILGRKYIIFYNTNTALQLKHQFLKVEENNK